MLSELKRLLGEATQGPWGNMDEDECEPQPCVATYHNDVRFDGIVHYACGPEVKTVAQAQADARLIAAAVNALPKLLAVCEAAHGHLLKVDAQRDEQADARARGEAALLREKIETLRADLTAARALLRECLDAMDYVDEVGLRARIEAHLGRSE